MSDAPPRSSQAGHEPRRRALRVLHEVESSSAFSNRSLAKALDAAPRLERRDRGLITHIVYGVLRQRGRLDALIDAAADKPKKLQPRVRMLLRAAVFERFELERPLAIVNSQARRLAYDIDRRGKIAGLVTAILRRVDASGPDWLASWNSGPVATALEKYDSLPTWLAGRWQKQLGDEGARARARAIAQPPPCYLRVDTTRLGSAECAAALRADVPDLDIRELPEYPAALRTSSAGDIFHHRLHEEGRFSIQSLGSQAASSALRVQPGERVLDACAGMGIKTMHLAELMQRQGSLTAIEPNAARRRALLEHAERCKISPPLSFHVSEGTLESFVTDHGETPPSFDAVLLDAPCSGLGNLARHPELRWRSSEAELAVQASRQSALLSVALDLVAAGGRLVYAVCSLEPEESTAIVHNVASEAAHGRVELEHEERFTPESEGCDGFYLARLRVHA